MTDHRAVRASDADREAVIERLGRALVQGRLTAEEFDQRAGQVYSAKTIGELAAITGDLPGHLW